LKVIKDRSVSYSSYSVHRHISYVQGVLFSRKVHAYMKVFSGKIVYRRIKVYMYYDQIFPPSFFRCINYIELK